MKNAWTRGLERIGFNPDAFAVVCANYGGLAVHNVFMYYYVTVFVQRYKISQGWFQFAQVLFIPWNSLNDLFFGYYGDLSQSRQRDRRKVVKKTGPFFALAFLVPWFPVFGSSQALVGVHLIFSLFFYDLMFTWIEISLNALFAEFSQGFAERVEVMKIGQTTSAFGLLAVFLVSYLSRNLEDFATFQLLSVLLGALTVLCTWYTGTFAPETKPLPIPSSDPADNEQLLIMQNGKKQSSVDRDRVGSSIWQRSWHVFRQVIKEKPFLVLCCADFLHLLSAAAQQNFILVYTNVLFVKSLPPGSLQYNAFYAACTILPFVAGYPLAPLLKKYGALNLAIISRGCSVLVGILLFLAETNDVYLIQAYMIFESISIHGFYQCVNLMWTQVIDQDTALHHRSQPISGLIFSQKAFFTKPAQSLAPMVLMFLLHRDGYEQSNAQVSFAGVVRTMAGFWTLCAALETMVLQLFSTGWKPDVPEVTSETETEKLVES